MPMYAATAAERQPVYVADVREASASQHLLAASLEGIANRAKDGPRVFLLTNVWDGEWLRYALRIAPAQTIEVTADELFAKLKGIVKGQVIYDPASPYALDLATTAAGLRDLVITDVDLGIPTLYDLRNRFHSAADAYAWAVTELLPECDRTAAALLPANSVAMRDFAIARRLFTFSPPESLQDGAFDSVLFHLPPGTAIYGSAGAEQELAPALRDRLSSTSHFLVPAAGAANLSFLSGIEPGRAYYQYLSYLEAVAPRYLTLIFDCSDLDFALNEMPGLWRAPQRGALPLGWAIPAALSEVADPVTHRYYADAYWSGTDQFVAGPSGAGQLGLASASAPYAFYRSTQKARAALDIDGCLFDAAGMSPDDLGEQLARFASETGMRGIFLTGIRDTEPMLLQGVPVLAAPRVGSAEEAVNYLNRIPMERREAALVLDPRRLGPADAAHIAAHVADRYVVVPPGEMLELMREIALPEVQGAASVLIPSVDYTEQPQPDIPLSVTATVQPIGDLFAAQVVYRPSAGRFAFARALLPSGGSSLSASIPPLLQGGEFAMRVRARDTSGHTTWSPEWTRNVPRADTDSDRLSDAEEAYMLTDANSPDTDGDGLIDSNDPEPLQVNRFPATYAGPVESPNDLPYLPDAGGSVVGPEGRTVQPGGGCMYWLPVAAASADAAIVVALDASGPAAVAVGAQPDQFGEQFAGVLSDTWYSSPLPPDVETTGAFVRLSCPQGAGAPLVIRSVSLVSPPSAPSVFRVSAFPASPGPEQSITISAVAFSPRGLDRVGLAYRINAGGTIVVPMTAQPPSQTYEARIPSLENRDELEYWIVATDKEGNRIATVPTPMPIGGRARDVISLLARRDFVGGWVSSPDWSGAGRSAPEAEGRDYANVDLAAGAYTVWILAGGRGQGIDVYVKDAKIGSIEPRLADGWQRIGRVHVEGGRTRIDLVSRGEPDAPAGVAPRYAVVIITADSSFSPPAGRLLDIHNSIALLSPAPNQTISGSIELVATGAGNITGAEISLDGEVVRRVFGPPFHVPLNTQRFSAGPHTLRIEAVDRSDLTGLAVEIPVTIAAQQ
jgi:hypothetical protein